jgi:hypothetical protein
MGTTVDEMPAFTVCETFKAFGRVATTEAFPAESVIALLALSDPPSPARIRNPTATPGTTPPDSSTTRTT